MKFTFWFDHYPWNEDVPLRRPYVYSEYPNHEAIQNGKRYRVVVEVPDFPANEADIIEVERE